MSKLVITLSSAKSQAQLEQDLEIRMDDKYGSVQDLVNILRGAMGGAEALSLAVLYSNTAASLTNQGVTYTARDAGTQGNAITVALIDPAGPDEELSIAVAGTAITVNLATDSMDAITTTATDLVAALKASPAAMALVSVAGAGASALAALTATPLASGTDQTKTLKFNVA